MTLYRQGRVYWFKKMMDGRLYRRSLQIRVGQEVLLSSAVEQMDLAVTAEHKGLPYKRQALITFSGYVTRYLEAETSQVSPAELDKKRQRLSIIEALWATRELRQIGRDEVSRLERHLLDVRKVSETTVNRYFELVRHLWRRAIEDGFAVESPTRFFTPFREGAHRRALTREEIGKVIAAAAEAAKTPHAPNFQAILDMVMFALHTGARLGEIIGLRLEYVRGSLALIPIQETKSRRRTSRRATSLVKTIPLDTTALAAIELHRAGRTAGYVFPLRRRHPNAVNLAVAKVRALSGVPDFGFHVMRHTFVTEASERLGISTARLLVSHADLKTTARYTHPRLSELEDASIKMGIMLPGYDSIK